MKIHTLIFRLACLPFWACLTAIAFFYKWLIINYNFLLYGGESVAYTKFNDKPMIADVYELVKDHFNKDLD